MKKLKYLIFLFIIFITSNVFADTSYDVTSQITSPVNFTECGVGSYTGVELNGATNCWKTKTRNQGALSRIYFNLLTPNGSDWSCFPTDTQYRLTLKMATNDWRNNFGTVAVRPGLSYTNNFVDSFSFVSRQQVNITFTLPYSGSTCYQSLIVDLPATNTNSLITGETNWNLNSVVLTKLTSGSGGGSTTPSGPSTSFDDTAIINNANENTQDIINNNNTNTQDIINNNNHNTQEITDNQNQNTQDLIDNQNQNTQDIIDNLTKCEIVDKNSIELDNRWLNSNGIPQVSGSGTNGVTSFFNVKNSTILVNSRITAVSDYYCFYDSTYRVISCSTLDSLVNDTYLDIPKNAFYFRSTINKNQNKPTFKICRSVNQSIDDSITNPNVDNDTGTGFFDNFTNQDFGLSQIITIPLNTIQSLTSKSCVPLQVPIPFTNSNINLPCMTEIYETKFPSIYNLWKIVSFGIVAYLIAIDIFHIVKGFKDPESDKVEVLDL